MARYYRLDFPGRMCATVNWERDSKREELLTDMRGNLGMGLRLVNFPLIRFNPGGCR